jgi:hypothetical protein
MKKDALVVVSKYTEYIEWVEEITHPIIVYDKSKIPVKNSIYRPNIGREAETLLYYIITNYNNLPTKTIFLQGDPRGNPVTYNYSQVIEEVNKEHAIKLMPILAPNFRANINDYWLKSCGQLHSILFHSDPIVEYSSGAQYVIPNQSILKRPIELYIALHMLMVKFGKRHLDFDYKLNDGISAWTMELIWGTLFNTEVSLKSDALTNLYKLLEN